MASLTVSELRALKIGDPVYCVAINNIVEKYTYAGLHFCEAEGWLKHVLLSPHLVSTICISEGKEHQSRSISNRLLFKDKAEAVSRLKEKIKGKGI